MTETRRIPQRTCIGCRTIADAPGLYRFIAPTGQILLETDREATLTALRTSENKRGRGAWLHFRKECVAKAVKTHSFARALRRAVVEVSSDSILARMQEHVGRTNNAQGDLR